MADFVHRKGLTRAATFDETLQSPADERSFTKLSKRAQTFVSTSSSSRSNRVSFAERKGVSDVMYRRFFGMEDDHAVKVIPPLNANRDDKLPTSEHIREAPSVSCVGERDAVVVVDVFSTGALLAYHLFQAGFKLICVLSGDLKDLLDMKPEGLEYSFAHTLVYDVNLTPQQAVDKLTGDLCSLDLDIKAVFAGAETGVELTDQLSEALGLLTNGTAMSEARRNKWVMGETIRAAGLRAVKQLKATSWGEIDSWLSEWRPEPFQVIVKPMDSAGSDDVTLCMSMSEVQQAFGNIMGKVNGLGIVNRAVLVQEYLDGIEYVVDMVSRDGEHKVLAVWEYDRRAVNGAAFVCFGQRLLTMEEEPCRALVDYQRRVVTALGIRHGPTHGEVKWCRGEPVLVEVGARCQGGDGMCFSVADECLGYDQVRSTMEAYLFPEKFRETPSEPVVRRAYGLLKWLVNYGTGSYERAHPLALREMTTMDSYRGHQIFLVPGKHVVPTQNCFTWGGCVKMTHVDEAVLNKQYARLEALEKSILFTVKPDSATVSENKKKGVVAVVDPFSTGAVLSAELDKAGYDVVAIYSAKLENLAKVQNLVPQGLTLTFQAVVAFEDDSTAMANSVLAACHSKPLLAVIAGAETGVEVADQLSELLGLLSNGTAMTEARRNKWVMGETIRAAGLRAVKQLKATSWGEIDSWLSEWRPEPFQVIVKPMDSGGSDDVTLCVSMAEVQKAFNHIMGKVNGLGIVNRAVLVQEYLDGIEYVVDLVSRDGEHKVLAVWEYDRRAVNGAGFVCFGQRLLTMEEEPCRALVDYQRRVVTALGIRHGPTHGEVKWCRGEPVLVEVGARCHGAEGVWQHVANFVYGYNQIGATVHAFLEPDNYRDLIPPEPVQRQGHGRLLFLILYESGTLTEINAAAVEEIESMASFQFMEIFVKQGQAVRRTVDCYTFGGVLRLVHENNDRLIADYNRIHELSRHNLFVVQTV